MIIAGSTYLERCQYPKWERLFGSGMRAAIAASGLWHETVLHSYVPSVWRNDAEATLSSFGIVGNLAPTKHELIFEYLDTLQKSFIPDALDADQQEAPLQVKGDVVLRFGFMEGSAKVEGRTVVYDPQNSYEPYHENGSTAERLAMIVSTEELLGFGGFERGAMPTPEKLTQAADNIFDSKPSPQVLLCRDRLGGIQVFFGGPPISIPSYNAESYFRIGVGDVLAAAFAHAWGERGLEPVEAADFAARSIAHFIEDARLPLLPPENLNKLRVSRKNEQRLRVLGVGRFEAKSLVVQTQGWIETLGGAPAFAFIDQDQAKGPIDLLIMGSNENIALSAGIREQVGEPKVVFWPERDRRTVEMCFPASRIAGDYPTALYHAMKVPSQ
ncbi:MAG: hypothetical protein E5V66_16925 [Mesorhizobium sp.]|uniref:hypothetical protein n=1 Tax=unclassified Mesorhizobium TaxID=325217 RepID=UPI000FCC0D11|nr:MULTISPECIES: hypothetical protein [unclassified Mesorhizobium]RUW72274.1 hypothetical protein EOA29_33540 [Mesorhizobium sp. M1E.F.Ca.ET.063.01.1.1]TIW10728.1 MAG: hypothetical protein E5V66_16925 [Mesorhizobium sp.]